MFVIISIWANCHYVSSSQHQSDSQNREVSIVYAQVLPARMKLNEEERITPMLWLSTQHIYLLSHAIYHSSSTSGLVQAGPIWPCNQWCASCLSTPVVHQVMGPAHCHCSPSLGLCVIMITCPLSSVLGLHQPTLPGKNLCIEVNHGEEPSTE